MNHPQPFFSPSNPGLVLPAQATPPFRAPPAVDTDAIQRFAQRIQSMEEQLVAMAQRLNEETVARKALENAQNIEAEKWTPIEQSVTEQKQRIGTLDQYHTDLSDRFNNQQTILSTQQDLLDQVRMANAKNASEWGQLESRMDDKMDTAEYVASEKKHAEKHNETSQQIQALEAKQKEWDEWKRGVATSDQFNDVRSQLVALQTKQQELDQTTQRLVDLQRQINTLQQTVGDWKSSTQAATADLAQAKQTEAAFSVLLSKAEGERHQANQLLLDARSLLEQRGAQMQEHKDLLDAIRETQAKVEEQLAQIKDASPISSAVSSPGSSPFMSRAVSPDPISAASKQNTGPIILSDEQYSLNLPKPEEKIATSSPSSEEEEDEDASRDGTSTTNTSASTTSSNASPSPVQTPMPSLEPSRSPIPSPQSPVVSGMNQQSVGLASQPENASDASPSSPTSQTKVDVPPSVTNANPRSSDASPSQPPSLVSSPRSSIAPGANRPPVAPAPQPESAPAASPSLLPAASSDQPLIQSAEQKGANAGNIGFKSFAKAFLSPIPVTANSIGGWVATWSHWHRTASE